MSEDGIDVKGNGEKWKITNVKPVAIEGMLITLAIEISVQKPNCTGGYGTTLYRQISLMG